MSDRPDRDAFAIAVALVGFVLVGYSLLYAIW